MGVGSFLLLSSKKTVNIPDVTQDYWWKAEEPGAEAWNVAISLESDQQHRRQHYQELLDIYEEEGDQYDDGELRYNLSRAACDTVHAEIAGRQKPAPKFQTAGADWKTKRTAKLLEKYMLGFLAQAQQPYLNGWELMEDSFLDSPIGGVMAVKVLADFDEERVRLERHFAHELFVDPVEARYGTPKSLFHIYPMDRGAALAAFLDEDNDEDEDDDDKTDEEKHESRVKKDIDRAAVRYAIESSESVRPDDIRRRGTPNVEMRVADQIKIVEAWRLPCGGSPGMHIYCTNGVTLFKEEWDSRNFPFVLTRWQRDRMGFWGKGLIDQGKSIQDELNDNAAKLQERFRLCGAKRTFYAEGSIDAELLAENEAETFIPYKGQSAPTERTPSPIADAEAMWLDSQFQKFFEITGVSQMRASARKEPGVTAGVAIRTLNDMQTARFALKAKSYENSYVYLTNLVIECSKALHRAGIDVEVGAGKRIKWSEVDLPANTFDISIAPTSSLPNEPAGRMQMIQELYDKQLITRETFMGLLGWQDLEREMNGQTAQTNYLEQVLDEILDGNYEPPDGHIMDKQRAIVMATQTYFEAIYNRAPESVIMDLSNFIAELSHQFDEQQKAIAQAAMLQQQALVAQQEAGMMPPAGGPPGQV